MKLFSSDWLEVTNFIFRLSPPTRMPVTKNNYAMAVLSDPEVMNLIDDALSDDRSRYNVATRKHYDAIAVARKDRADRLNALAAMVAEKMTAKGNWRA